MSDEGGSDQAVPVGAPAHPENIVDRSVRAFLVAPLIQNVVLWIIFAVWMLVGKGGAIRFSFSTGFWWFAGGVLLVSHVIAGTLGVLVHVMCIKLGFWKFRHYLLAGLLAGAIPAIVWGFAVTSQNPGYRALGAAAYFVPSALVVAVVVWLMVFWRNPSPRSTADLDAFS
jgi:hypothetical protein